MEFKSLMVAALVLVCAPQVFAQTDSAKVASGKNIIKLNVLSLPFKNIHLQYERAIANKISFGLGLRMMPKGTLPFRSAIEDLIDDEDLSQHVSNFRTGNIAITPEVRFYLGKKALKGFYIAPFARFSRYTAELPYTFEVEDPNGSGTTYKKAIDLSGNVTTFTGGLMFGAQFKLSKMLYLDWWILGPQYGAVDGSIDGFTQLNSDEQEALRDALEDFDDLPLVKTKSEVTANGARLDFTGPWAGLRTGLALGIRF